MELLDTLPDWYFFQKTSFGLYLTIKRYMFLIANHASYLLFEKAKSLK